MAQTEMWREGEGDSTTDMEGERENATNIERGKMREGECNRHGDGERDCAAERRLPIYILWKTTADRSPRSMPTGRGLRWSAYGSTREADRVFFCNESEIDPN